MTGVKGIKRFLLRAMPKSNSNTHLSPSSRNAKSPISRSRKRYRGGSDILQSSSSEVDRWITSSTIPLSTSWLVATYPSFRLDWRKLMILDNTFATFFDTLIKNKLKVLESFTESKNKLKLFGHNFFLVWNFNVLLRDKNFCAVLRFCCVGKWLNFFFYFAPYCHWIRLFNTFYFLLTLTRNFCNTFY